MELDGIYARLIKSSDEWIDSSEAIKEDIKNSKRFQERFCCDNVYKREIEIIRLANSTHIIDETVGSYLYGCFQPEIVVEIACTPSCVNGVKNPDIEDCQIASYEKRAGKITKLNQINSEDGNLFVINGQTITQDDKNFLLNDGITVITIYNQDGNTINYVLGESIDLTGSISVIESSNDNKINGWYWLLGIMGIIIISILILFIIYAQNIKFLH